MRRIPILLRILCSIPPLLYGNTKKYVKYLYPRNFRRGEMEVNMRCVICDDNYSDREKIKKIIQMFFSEQKIPIHIKQYSNLNDFAKDDTFYDFIVMDIIFNNENNDNGLDFIRRYHRNFPESKIIYYYSSISFAPDSYEAFGFSYLIKPIQVDPVFKVMNRIIFSDKINEITFTIKNSYKAKINSNKIVYIQSQGRYTELRTELNSIICVKTMKQWEEELKKFPFCSCKRGTLVNLYYVKEIDSFGSIILKNGEKLKMSFRSKNEFVQRFIDYYGDKYV